MISPIFMQLLRLFFFLISNFVQLLSHDHVDCSMPGFPALLSLLEFVQAHVYWLNDDIQPSHPLSPPFPPDPNLSQHQGLMKRPWCDCLHRWPKHWSFSFSISPSNEYSGLIFSKIDWFNLTAVQGTLKSLLQHHSSKASVLLVLSLLYGPTLTSIHDCWENNSFDCMGLCHQSDVSAL